MSEFTPLNAARSNNVKQFDRCGQGKSACKYVLFLVQISVQIHTLAIRSDEISRQQKKNRCERLFNTRGFHRKVLLSYTLKPLESTGSGEMHWGIITTLLNINWLKINYGNHHKWRHNRPGNKGRNR